jgi:hypothetical protein
MVCESKRVYENEEASLCILILALPLRFRIRIFEFGCIGVRREMYCLFFSDFRENTREKKESRKYT